MYIYTHIQNMHALIYIAGTLKYVYLTSQLLFIEFLDVDYVPLNFALCS
jgi:hypothetical protein